MAFHKKKNHYYVYSTQRLPVDVYRQKLKIIT